MLLLFNRDTLALKINNGVLITDSEKADEKGVAVALRLESQ